VESRDSRKWSTDHPRTAIENDSPHNENAYSTPWMIPVSPYRMSYRSRRRSEAPPSSGDWTAASVSDRRLRSPRRANGTRASGRNRLSPRSPRRRRVDLWFGPHARKGFRSDLARGSHEGYTAALQEVRMKGPILSTAGRAKLSQRQGSLAVLGLLRADWAYAPGAPLPGVNPSRLFPTPRPAAPIRAQPM
jgi:hypothetical protein